VRFPKLVLLLASTLPAAAAAAAAAADAGPQGQLATAVRPVAYRLDLTILPDQAKFSGVAEIEVEVAAPASVIYLHGNGLEVASAEFTSAAGARRAARYAQLDDTGVASLSFDAPVPAGRGSLRLTYAAPFRTGGEGLYHTTVEGLSYAFTQFEPIDARRMFPGFDEPVFKTPFDIAVTTQAGNAVIGNAPVRGERPAGEGRKRVEFETTKPLPTYLIALAVGPLDVVESAPLPPNAVRDRPLPLRAVATRGKGGKLAYALANTEAIVRYLEEYFGVAFPYPKLDLIASPESGVGGMENAGAIVYGDARLLVAEDASLEQRRGFGSIHAHELAHQWFGDLVTPKWWDDIWLNESFANWMGFKASAVWKPEYRLDTVPALQTAAVMGLDSRIAARQIRQPVSRNLDIASAFDAITYLKGGAVLGMFESWLGEEGFRAGIRTHMKRFPYAVADVEDFMASLAQGSGRPGVVPAFRSFIDQPGVPLVNARLECSEGRARLRLAQSRYLPTGSHGDPKRSWQLPLCVRYGTDRGVAKECLLMTATEATLLLPAGSCPAFAMPNADGAGYYRFALDDQGWSALMANLSRLNEKETLAVADSLSAAYQANRISTEAYLGAVRTLAGSSYPQVAMAPAPDLIRLRDDLAPAGAREAVLALMRALYQPRLEALGPAPRAPASAASAAEVDQALFRTRLVKLLALDAGDRGLRTGLAADAKRYLRMGEAGAGLDASAVSPALTEIALRAGVQELGAPFAETLIERMLASSDTQFRLQAAAALGNTDDAALGERMRALLLDPRLRGREPTTLAFALAGRASQRRATFDWFKANHEAFIGRISHFAYRFLPQLGAGFCTLAERDELNDFFRPMVGRLDGTERALAETSEGIELCAALADAKREEVNRYFASQEGRKP
jgi:alanyl aminopeptidase